MAETPARRSPIRCAIYTRKSTEEGLEQEFNSLHAQREACAAYVLSQRHEGWTLLPDYYDDGGLSGGHLNRPALLELLEQVKAGRIDIIVVYKIDRLTRSLSDFAKIVDVLDGAGTSFVSVTQSFNTTTSMGRLTLNVLLSFAQFEREVTGERIRDKIAASKAKGMWMGGVVPIGYDVQARKLVVNEAEAETVRYIFRSYAELGSVERTVARLIVAGVRSKQRVLKSGRIIGDVHYGKGALAALLQNQIYRGIITHKGEAFPGEHPPIVEAELWEAVQMKLAAARHAKHTGSNAREPSLLAGMIVDGLGRIMTPSHTSKGSRRYRYYVSRSEVERADQQVWRIPAHDVERLVVEKLVANLNDGRAVAHSAAADRELSAQQVASIQSAARLMAAELVDLATSVRRAVLLRLNVLVTLHLDRLEVQVDLSSLLDQAGDPEDRTQLTIPVQLKRRGYELRLVMPPQAAGPVGKPDAGLIALLARAHAAREHLAKGAADGHDYSSQHLMRLARLSYLAPDIVTAILEGRQPVELNSRRLLKATNIPLCWKNQRKMLGFPS